MGEPARSMSTASRLGRKPSGTDPTVWASYGDVGIDVPWYGHSYTAFVVSTIETRDPRWWLERLGRVALRLDLYPGGMAPSDALRWPVHLGSWGLDDDPSLVSLPPDEIEVVAPDGAIWRAVPVPGGDGEVARYVASVEILSPRGS